MPPPAKITALALRLLEEAFAEAAHVPVDRPVAMRLALAWLVHAGIAKDWQAKAYWDAIGGHNSNVGTPSSSYCRDRDITGLLDFWHRAAGNPEPGPIERGKWLQEASERIDLEALADQIWRMCNRYRPSERQKVGTLFRAREFAAINDGPSIVHPRDPGLVVRLHEGERVMEQMTWGFPIVLRGKAGQKLKPKAVNNARFDKLGGYWKRWAQSPERRCLIPTSAFAEAEGDYGSMTTTWLSLIDEPTFAWAGLWSDDVTWGRCYTGVMTDAALGLEAIHDRCPVILRPDEWEAWLTAPLAELKQFDRAPPAESFEIDRTNIPWAKGGQPRLL